jgi:aminoglycoside phosphotransferase (APT) family kinase protein
LTAVSDTRLRSVIAAGAGGVEVRILDRRPLDIGGSHRKELVTSSIAGSPPLKMLVKHGAGQAHRSHGHYKGVEYEGEIYADVLKPLGASVAALYGYEPGTGSTDAWVAIEYLEGALRVNRVPDPWAMPGAARWIGALQRRAEPLVGGLPPRVHRYDSRYYAGWARRASRFGAEFADDPAALSQLCQTFVESAPMLAARTPTLVHGEYYPGNVLAVDGAIRPVDWESAAMGLGEIDIAMLIEAWPRDIAAECVGTYWHARCPAGVPDDARWALDMARLYVQFRWLGDCGRRTRRESPATRVRALEAIARRLGTGIPEAGPPRLAASA